LSAWTSPRPGGPDHRDVAPRNPTCTAVARAGTQPGSAGPGHADERRLLPRRARWRRRSTRRSGLLRVPVPAEQDAARRLFLRLVARGRGHRPCPHPRRSAEDATERHVMAVFADPGRRLLSPATSGRAGGGGGARGASARLDTLQGWWRITGNGCAARCGDGLAEGRGEGRTDPIGSTLLQRAREFLADPGDVRLDLGCRPISTGLSPPRMPPSRRRARQLKLRIRRSGTLGRRRTGGGGEPSARWQPQRLSLPGWPGWQSSLRCRATQRKDADNQRDKAEHNLAVARDAASGLVFDLAQVSAIRPACPWDSIRKILDRA